MLLAASPSPSRAAPDAHALVAGLKRDAPATTKFAEVRFSGLLDRPLILRGELEYDGPGKLARRVAAATRLRGQGHDVVAGFARVFAHCLTVGATVTDSPVIRASKTTGATTQH